MYSKSTEATPRSFTASTTSLKLCWFSAKIVQVMPIVGRCTPRAFLAAVMLRIPSARRLKLPLPRRISSCVASGPSIETDMLSTFSSTSRSACSGVRYQPFVLTQSCIGVCLTCSMISNTSWRRKTSPPVRVMFFTPKAAMSSMMRWTSAARRARRALPLLDEVLLLAVVHHARQVERAHLAAQVAAERELEGERLRHERLARARTGRARSTAGS